MKEVTVFVPEQRIAEFYRRFGEFMSETEEFTAASELLSGDRVPAWVTDPGAVHLAQKIWSNLSAAGQTALGLLVDGALEERPKRFTPRELVEHIDHPNGVSGVAGVFGSAGRAVKKAGAPRYLSDDGDPWHFVWDWDGTQYWMAPQVAALFREAGV
ncbi:DUF6416 domain-containing protein [Cryobacterium melibiosiphilum]|uniref:DUF6416 domain-containing protein n=1 Tax=Cryobacterium melibiosiphilum TaxID=995039 RepID=UPI0011C22A35|nr:DUF6416 domain-containing protein [Cryobacterium melibiosiphilum]